MFEGAAFGRRERRLRPVDISQQVALAVTRDPVAQDEIMHAPADVDRVDLHVAVVGEGGAHVGHGSVEQQRPAHKTAGGQGGDLERRGQRR